MKNKSRFLNKEVRVEFLDHASNTRELMHCVIRGKCVEETAEKLVINVWELPKEHGAVKADNEELYVIGRALVTAIKVLR